MSQCFDFKPKETYRELIRQEISRINFEIRDALEKSRSARQLIKLMYLLACLDECLEWSPNGPLTVFHFDTKVISSLFVHNGGPKNPDLVSLIGWVNTEHQMQNRRTHPGDACR